VGPPVHMVHQQYPLMQSQHQQQQQHLQHQQHQQQPCLFPPSNGAGPGHRAGATTSSAPAKPTVLVRAGPQHLHVPASGLGGGYSATIPASPTASTRALPLRTASPKTPGTEMQRMLSDKMQSVLSDKPQDLSRRSIARYSVAGEPEIWQDDTIDEKQMKAALHMASKLENKRRGATSRR